MDYLMQNSSMKIRANLYFQRLEQPTDSTRIFCTIFLNQCALYIYKRGNYLLSLQMSLVYEQICSFIRTIQPSFQFHSNDLNYCSDAIAQLVKRHPKRASQRFQELINILSEMLKQPCFNLQNYADFYEVIIESFCCLPRSSRTNQKSISQILQGGVMVLSKVSTEVTSDWSHPIQSMAGDEPLYCNEYQLRICKEVMQNIDSFASQIGYQLIRAIFRPIFLQQLNFNNDWQLKYGALLIASQIGEGVQHIDQIRIYVQKALIELQSECPKVKFAALELIGEYSDQLRPIFQQEYFEIIVPSILQQLMDSIPRIVCHAFASLSNFFSEFSQYWKIECILTQLLPPIIHYLKNGSPFMQESALQTLFCLASVRKSLGPNLNELIQACGELIERCVQITNQTQVLQQTFLTLSLILTKQNRQIVEQYIPHYVESLLLNKDKIGDHSFLCCWSNLCLQYDAFIDLESTNIVHHLLTAIEKEVQQGNQASAVSSLECLCSTFKSYTWKMRPYLQTIFLFGKKIFNNSDHFQTTRNKAVGVIVDLLINIRTNEVPQQDIFQNTAKSILQFLLQQGNKCIQDDGQIHLLIGVLTGIKSIIPSIGTYLDQPSISNISCKLIEFRRKMQEILGDNNEASTEQHVEQHIDEVSSQDNEDYQDVQEIDRQDIELAEDLQQVIDLIPEIYQNLIKVSGNSEKRMLVGDIIPQISFSAGKSDQSKLFALNLALALVQSCAYQDLSDYWANLMDLFISFSCHSKSTLRNQAVYGMGVVFMKTPIELISQQNVGKWMQLLWNSHFTPYDKDAEKNSINYCKDNIISAFGKLLKSFGPRFPQFINLNLYRKWLEFLPLRHDQEERDCQQQILLEILGFNPSLIIQDSSDLKRVCQIFAAYTIQCIQQKDSATMKKTKQVLCHMGEWDLFQRSSQYVWSNLTSNQQTAITNLMAYE